MACRAWRWPEDPEKLRAVLAPAFAHGVSLSQAARVLNCTDAALRAVCREKGIDWRELQRAAIVPPVACEVKPPPRNDGEVSEPDPPPLIDWTGARSSSSGVERRVILGDLHVPFHSLPA